MEKNNFKPGEKNQCKKITTVKNFTRSKRKKIYKKPHYRKETI